MHAKNEEANKIAKQEDEEICYSPQLRQSAENHGYNWGALHKGVGAWLSLLDRWFRNKRGLRPLHSPRTRETERRDMGSAEPEKSNQRHYYVI